MSILNNLDNLDWPLVEKVARNELDLMSRLGPGSDRTPLTPEYRAASIALARAHLGAYLDDRTAVALDVALWALCEHHDDRLRPRPLTDEFVAGHALALTALKHGADDAARAMAGKERAREGAFGLNLMADIGEVTPDRMVGIDMTRPIQSRQTCTPQEVMARAEDLDLWTGDGERADGPCADMLTFADCEEIAQGLMDSFGGLDLDYADLEEVDDRIIGRVQANLAALGTGEDEPRPPFPLSAQRAQAAGPGRDQETGAPGWEPEL